MSVATVTEAEALPGGQWVEDADGDFLCRIDTHLGFAQPMWLVKGGTMCVALDQATFPLELCDLDEPEGYVCPHRRTNECGYCYRCGQPGGEAFPLLLDEQGLELIREVGAMNARAFAARAETQA